MRGQVAGQHNLFCTFIKLWYFVLSKSKRLALALVRQAWLMLAGSGRCQQQPRPSPCDRCQHLGWSDLSQCTAELPVVLPSNLTGPWPTYSLVQLRVCRSDGHVEQGNHRGAAIQRPVSAASSGLRQQCYRFFLPISRLQRRLPGVTRPGSALQGGPQKRVLIKCGCRKDVAFRLQLFAWSQGLSWSAQRTAHNPILLWCQPAEQDLSRADVANIAACRSPNALQRRCTSTWWPTASLCAKWTTRPVQQVSTACTPAGAGSLLPPHFRPGLARRVFTCIVRSQP